MTEPRPACVAFSGTRRIASGDLRKVAVQARAAMNRDKWAQVLIFDAVTSDLIEVDLRCTAEDVFQRFSAAAESTQPTGEPAGVGGHARGPGRPKLGVVAREITLLPRHWEWLAGQPGGASVALRKLVEHARLANQGADRRRRAQEAAYRFLSAMAGNEPGFEEAIRALFANESDRFRKLVKSWPVDVRNHARKLAAAAFEHPHTVRSSRRKQ